MAVDGIASLSGGASVDGDGSESEDDDLFPLSSIFALRRPPKGLPNGERARRQPSNSASVRGAGDREGVSNLRGGRGLPEGEGDCGVSACGGRGSFVDGDLVWAKAFPYTWWPGWVRKSSGAVRLVSFFGGDRSLWLEESSIRCFEEDYVRMSRMAGARLACQVDCALAELGRRTALGTACGFRGVVGSEDENLITQIARERERFEPAEMLRFVLCLAVHAWVDDGQTIRAVRVAAQANAYRIHVTAARRAEVNGVFQPEEALDTIRCLAVTALADDEAAAGMARVVAQLNDHRHFVSTRPDWFYQSPAEESDGSTSCSASDDSEGTDLGMSFMALFENEEGKDLDSLYEDDSEEQDEKDSMMRDGELCLINRIDYSILSSDTEFEHLSDDEMENVSGWSEGKGVSFDTNMSNSFSRYASSVDGVHGKEFDQSVPPVSSIEMHRPVDFSLTDASTSCSLEFTTENSSRFIIGSSLKHQPSLVAGLFRGKKGCFQVLQEMLYDLHCLARDPFHMRSDNLLPLCQLVLSYRASIFQNISRFSSMFWAEEAHKTQDHDVWEHHHLMNENGGKHQGDRIADMCECSSTAGALFSSDGDGIGLLSSAECHGNLHTPHATRETITLHSADVNDASITVDKKYSAGVKFQLNAERRLSGEILVDKRYSTARNEFFKGVSHLTFPTIHDSEVATQKRRFDQEVISPTSSNLHTSNSLGSDVKESKMSIILLDSTRSKDSKTFYINQRDMNDESEGLSPDNASYGAITIQSGSNFSAASITPGNDIESKAVTCSSDLPSTCRYKDGSSRKRTLGQPGQSYISMWQKDYHFASTRFYASPLVRDSSSVINRAQCSPLIGRTTGPCNSLHMKFPRGCNLPSKEDLVKIFRVFGPLDHSRTRVFFYTGAGKVVFLNPVDAETAYNYVRRNRLFETGMRFWLDTHDKWRNDYRTQTLSLSAGQIPELNLKSCLKMSSIHENEDMKKKRRVRFSI